MVTNTLQAIELTDKIDALLSITASYSQEIEVKKCLDIAWGINHDLRTFLHSLNPALSIHPTTPMSDNDEQHLSRRKPD